MPRSSPVVEEASWGGAAERDNPAQHEGGGVGGSAEQTELSSKQLTHSTQCTCVTACLHKGTVCGDPRSLNTQAEGLQHAEPEL